MISKLLILSIFILSLYSITPQPSSSLSYPTVCSTNDTEIVKVAALACQNDNYSKTTNCIWDYIRANYSGQYWGVMVKNDDDNPDFAAYWSVTSCLVKLENFGNTFKRTYLAWPIRDYRNTTPTLLEKDKPNNDNFFMKLSSDSTSDYPNYESVNLLPQPHLTLNSPSNLGDNCEEWKAETAKNVFQYCDVASNERAAQCIKQKLYNELDEYWGVYMSTGTTSGITVTFSYCGRQIKGYGLYSRMIIVWSGF